MALSPHSLTLSPSTPVGLLAHRDDVALAIPHARKLQWKGEPALVIPHRPDETRVLRNFGIEAEAPILRRYDWAGGNPFESQKITAAMLTTEKRAFVLSEPGCVDANTEYLTPSGWKRIADYTSGLVAQYDPTTRRAEFVAPEAFIKAPCPTMIRVRPVRGTDQLLSPDHTMLFEDDRGGYRTLLAQAARESFAAAARTQHRDWSGIPTTFSMEREGLPLSDALIRVMVMVKADGHYPPRKTGSRVCIRVKKARKKARVRALLREAGLPYKEVSRDYLTAKGFTVFSFNAPEVSKHYAHWWGASESQRRVIADEVLHWDGSVVRGERFSSCNKNDADFIQYVFASTGHTARVIQSERFRRGVTEHEYHVLIRRNRTHVGLAGGGSKHSRAEPTFREEPSSDGYKYCFTMPSGFLILRHNGCIFATGNCGKSRAALFAFDYLRKVGLAETMLIVSPLSTLRAAWLREIQQHLPHLSPCVVHGPATVRNGLLQSPEFNVFITNHDGVRHSLSALLACEFDVVCIDEMTGFKSANAKRSRAMQKIASRASYVWGMTGTPTPNGPEDAHGQVRVVRPDQVPFSATKWKDMTMQRVSTFRWVPRSNATELVRNAMSPAVRFKRSDVFELPPMQFVRRDAPMSVKQEKVYKTLMKNLLVTLQSGQSISVANAGVLFSKTLQAAIGFLIDNNGISHRVDPQSRLDAVTDAIREWDKRTKFLVFNPFRMGVKMVHEHLTKEGFGVEYVDGSTSEAKRSEIFARFRDDPTLEGIVAHPRCMSHGLTLVEANLIVWSAPYPSLETYEQANARISRPGQTQSQLVVQITGSKVEDAIYARLAQRQSLQKNLLRIIQEGLGA